MIALVTHSYPPDPAAVGQHMADLAQALVKKGHDVVVITSDRGYDDPALRFARRERMPDGIQIDRRRYSSFGKTSVVHRVFGIVSFMLQACWALTRADSLDGIVFSTSPPFIGVIATIVSKFRHVPTVFWAMDLNPDQLIALGKLPEHGIITRLMRTLNRWTMRRASLVVALDTIMAARLAAQGAPLERLTVIPPWAPDEALHPVARNDNQFRKMHGLTSSIVVMYSGNHTRSNPLTTLLAAAVALNDVSRLKFVFVGSGVAKYDVEKLINDLRLQNVLSLPYQPKSEIASSLSAADVHVVSLGREMAGVIHPCKIYGAMAVARPILYFGPAPSHVSAIVEECANGWVLQHGEVDIAVSVLRAIAQSDYGELDRMGARGLGMLTSRFRPNVLINAVADAVDRAFTVGSDVRS